MPRANSLNPNAPSVTPPPRPAEAPCLGIGVGLRPKHFPDVLERGPRGTLGVDWFEALSENYMADGGRPRRILDTVRSFAPVVLHGVSLNVGSADPLDRAYLHQLQALASRVEPLWVSDHLCWTGVAGHNLHDLIPLPYTGEVVEHVAARIRQVQETLGRRIAIENVSSYLSYAVDELSEWYFLAAFEVIKWGGHLTFLTPLGITAELLSLILFAVVIGAFVAMPRLDQKGPGRVWKWVIRVSAIAFVGLTLYAMLKSAPDAELAADVAGRISELRTRALGFLAPFWLSVLTLTWLLNSQIHLHDRITASNMSTHVARNG
jgi:hypothetical protein